MIPMIARIRAFEDKKKKVNLFIPMILIWIIVFAILILIIPFVLLASILLWRRGYGKGILLFYFYFFYLLFSLSGLKVDVKDKKKEFFISFN